jgi:hypothetical protein
MPVAVLIILFVAFVALIGWLAYSIQQARIRAWQQAATALGLQFSTDDPFDLLSLPFALFKRGEGRGCENVAWGARNAVDVRVFEFWDYTETMDTKGSSSRSYEHFSCALVQAPVNCPHTTIAPEGLLGRFAEALGFHDITFESEEFNHKMKVTSSDPKFANYLIDPRMMEWLLATRGWEYELSDGWILSHCRRVKPAAIGSVLDAAQGLHDHIPTVVLDVFKGTV